AEDGILDRNVTGVQTCALPISSPVTPADRPRAYVGVVGPGAGATAGQVEQARELGRALAGLGLVLVTGRLDGVMDAAAAGCEERSEERRVGRGWRCGGW